MPALPAMLALVFVLCLFLSPAPARAEAGPCGAQSAEACGEAAIAERRAGGDGPELEARLEAACFGDHAPSCSWYGWMVRGRMAWITKETAAKRIHAREAYEHGCALGHGPSCAGAASAELSWRTLGKKEHVPYVRSKLERGCELGSALGCRMLGDLHWRGLDGARDLARAASLYETGCEAEDGRSCTALAQMIQAEQVTQGALGTPTALLERACAVEDAGGCALLALDRLEAGETEALRELKDQCNRNSSVACAALGRAYIGGHGTSSDLLYGRALLQKACATDKGVECRYAGCERESPLACRWFAEALEQPDAPKEDRKRAVEVRARACEMGDPVSCGGG